MKQFRVFESTYWTTLINDMNAFGKTHDIDSFQYCIGADREHYVLVCYNLPAPMYENRTNSLPQYRGTPISDIRR